jgi:hypothetical protein
MQASQGSDAQGVSIGARALLVAVMSLVFLAGIQLYILSEQTDHYFAWTINPPLTAAFLGAGYWSAMVSAILALREKTWVRVRSTLPAALTSTSLLLIATLLHIDRFHLSSPEPITLVAAWVWLIVYVIVPPLGLVIWFFQLRLPGTIPPREDTLPPWMRVTFIVQAALALLVGIVVFVAPQSIAPVWPWAITPLTGRAIGAWFASIGVTTALIAWENDPKRVGAALAGLLTMGILEIIAVLRYSGSIDWAKPTAWVYVVFFISILLVGAVGVVRALQAKKT